METFLNLLVNNYIWLIAVSVFLIFSLIGFLVENGSDIKDKNDVVEPKPKKEKNEKPKKIKPEKPIKKEKINKKEKKEKEDILDDVIPTIGDLMKQQEQQNANSVEQLDTDLQIKETQIMENQSDSETIVK